MSSVDFTLPDLGEGVHEGQVMRLHVQEGDVVSEDQPLMEVETDKAAVEIPSPHSGVVSTIHVAERQLVHVGEVMVTFDCQDVAPAAAPAPEPQQMPLPPQEKTTERLMFPVDKDASTEEIGDLITDQLMASLSPTRRTPCSPSVRKLARTLDIDIATLDGSGSGGRVTREDVEAAAAPALTSPEPMTIADAPAPAPSSPEPVAIAEAMPPSQPTVATPVLIEEPIEGTSEQDDWGLVMRQPLSQARKAISRAMSTAWETIPHVTDCNDADITEPAGSGDIPARNYKMIAGLAALRGEIDREAIPAFVRERGMPGFSPTQGHVASAIPYAAHAIDALTAGSMDRVMLLAKGSLFLGRMTQMSDGISVLLERNPRRAPRPG